MPSVWARKPDAARFELVSAPRTPVSCLVFDPFQPTWRRVTAAIVVAGAAFALPQEAPLEYYPLNHPSDVYYLEITCQASAEGETQIFFDTGRGFNDLQEIRIPIAPSSQPYTYTFPMWDAPVQGMMVVPLTKPGTLSVTNLRIYTRSGREIKRFARDDFDATHEIARIAPTANGWEWITTPDARQPYSICGFFPPIIPDGMNARNLQRCLLSSGYLSGMLWILLLAVLFVAQWRPAAAASGRTSAQTEGHGGDSEADAAGAHVSASLLLLPQPLWRNLIRGALFMALLALLFSAVGNRGLIKDSIRYSRFPASQIKPGLHLEFDLAIDPPQSARLSWDTGQGFNAAESELQSCEPDPLYQTVRFDLPDLGKTNRSLRALRFTPFATAGTVRIFGIRVIDQGRRTRLRLPPDCLQAGHDIASVEIQDQQIVIRTAPAAHDPTLEFKPAAVQAIADAMQTEDRRNQGIGSEGHDGT